MTNTVLSEDDIVMLFEADGQVVLIRLSVRGNNGYQLSHC
jgi:hypothetical protein